MGISTLQVMPPLALIILLSMFLPLSLPLPLTIPFLLTLTPTLMVSPTPQSYKGAQVFEALGLQDEVMERCFTGTSSRIKGADFAAIFEDLRSLHLLAYPPHSDQVPMLNNPGHFHFRNGGEAHLNTPFSMVVLQQGTDPD